MKSKIFFLLLLTAVSCYRYARDPLTMSRESYNGNQLKTNGMYQNKDNIGIDWLFLYRNGIIRSSGGLDFHNKTNQQIEQYLKQRKSTDCCNDIVYAWGLFKIKNQDISIETWQTGEMFDKYRTKKCYGKILNDTTFIMNQFSTKGLDTFRFIPLSIKPDSTNRFIN